MTLAEESGRTIADLRTIRLEPEHWDGVRGALEDLATSAAAGDDAGARAALLELSRVAFAGKVNRRMPAGSTGAPAVVPTKRTSALPFVGVVCGSLLLGVGWQLGGGVVLAGCAVFALFILGVAVAGSRVTHDRSKTETPADTTVPAPPDVLAAADAAARAVAAS